MLVLQILLGALTGLFTARLAKQRGKNPVPWFWIGLLFGLLGLVFLLFMTRKKPAAPAPVVVPTAPDSPSPYWYFLDAEKKSVGPMSFDALFKRSLSHDDFVWNEKYTEWKVWKDVLAEASTPSTTKN